jgi:hypothetical protein
MIDMGPEMVLRPIEALQYLRTGSAPELLCGDFLDELSQIMLWLAISRSILIPM